MNPNKTQQQCVKAHLLANKSITSWQAITHYRITRLSAYILNLRRLGMKIKSTRIDATKNKNWYTKYSIK